MSAEPAQDFGREHLAATAALLSRAFPGARKFTPAFLDWQYYANPAGPPLGANLFEHRQLVGHLMGIPIEVTLDGAAALVTLVINIGLAPEARGGGRFRRLVEHVCAQSVARGHAGVIGVANAQSMAAFTGSLGFQGVAFLPAWVEFAPHRLEAGRALGAACFARRWRPETLAWRLANPANPLRVVARDEHALLVEGRGPLPGLAVRAAVARGTVDLEPTAGPTRAPAVALGIAPCGTLHRHLAWDIPARLRPSPLRLIWRDHRPGAPPLEATRVLFGLLDFDAF